MFKDDNFRIQQAQTVKDWLREQKTSSPTVDQSPDLNPSEETLDSGHTVPTSRQDLGEKLKQLWMEINVVTQQKLIDDVTVIKFQSKIKVVQRNNSDFFWTGSLR